MIPEENSNRSVKAKAVRRLTNPVGPVEPGPPKIDPINKTMPLETAPNKIDSGNEESINSETPKTQTQNKFWITTQNGLKLDPESLQRFLNHKGFFVYRPVGIKSNVLIKVENKRIKEVSHEDIRRVAWDYIDAEYEFTDPEEQRQVKGEFQRNRSLFSKDNLILLPEIKLNEVKDTKETSFFFFNDCYLEIKRTSIMVKDYATLDGLVFSSDISNINFRLSLKQGQTIIDAINPESEFYEFIIDLCKNQNQSVYQNSLESLVTIIGYLIHRYKDPGNAKAIILMDTYIDGNANGSTGKGLLTQGIGKVRASAFQDGKFFASSDKFALSHVSYGTRILFIDDVPKNFDFERIFPLITEKAVVERKYENKVVIPFEESPKIVLTTNYTVEGSGNSHRRRKVEFILSDTYSPDFDPEDRFGHLLYNDWDNIEWLRYYHFMIYSVQEFLKKGIIKPKFNVAERKLKMEASSQFIEYVNKHVEIYEKLNKKTVYDDFYSKNPGHHKIELTTFRNWLKYYADAYDLNFIESHSGSENFFEYTIKE